MRLSSSYSDWFAASQVLRAWRQSGQSHAQQILSDLQRTGATGILLSELDMRLSSAPGPRLLIDGLWLSRPYGGITRVWQQIFETWLLPGLINTDAEIALINRNSHLSVTDQFESLDGAYVDPLDTARVPLLAEENGRLVRDWGATVFCSTWISSTGASMAVCPELALVHDCMPERFRSRDPALLPLRRRWWKGAAAHLTVSSATAQDLHRLLGATAPAPQWCHLAPAPVFDQTAAEAESFRLWGRILKRASLPEHFLLLPATSAIGSYKNPELVAAALDNAHLGNLPLVLSGIAAEQRASELEQRFPHLRGRVHAAGFTDVELALAYRYALAVVIPSRIEGFGLPAIEVMASGGMPLIADVRGLQEAGAEAACRFSPDQPLQLSALLELLIDPLVAPWFRATLRRRAPLRLQRLNPDLIGLALLAQARQIAQNA